MSRFSDPLFRLHSGRLSDGVLSSGVLSPDADEEWGIVVLFNVQVGDCRKINSEGKIVGNRRVGDCRVGDCHGSPVG